MITRGSRRTSAILKVADEVWIAVALLHRAHPDRLDFTVAEIVARAEDERIAGRLRPGVYVHALRHCVANMPPDPARLRMLFATGRSTRRLFRPVDPYDPGREGGKVIPQVDDLPAAYRPLVRWYQQDFVSPAPKRRAADPILASRGAGRHLGNGEHPDLHVRQLRDGWA